MGLAAAAFAAPNAAIAGEIFKRKTPGKRPNFLFILADDLGWADIGCYGSDLHETPNIDRLAASAEKFTNAYAAAAVCTPTRASIMTGKYPARLHMTIWREWAKNPQFDRKMLPPDVEGNLPYEEITIAEVLRQAGYHTAHIGKWHLGDAAHYPELNGFEVNVGGSHWGCPATFFHPYRGVIYGSERYVPGLEADPDGDYFTPRDGEYLTDRLTDAAIKIIEDAGDRPFFVNLWYYTVHVPIEAKRRLVEHYKKMVRSGMHHRNPVYAAMVQNLDENVGRLLAKLDELGIADKTAVVFTSDNGGFISKWDNKTVTSNYPLRSGKGALYEGGIRVPTVVRWPGVTKAGSICRHPISSIDFYPTLLEIAGLCGDPRQNADMDGVSFAALLKEADTEPAQRNLYWHYPHYYNTTAPVGAVRQGDWKLLEYFEDKHVELYNLANDIGEKNDLSTKMPEKASELRGLLRAWREDTGAQLPSPNPSYKGAGSAK